MSRKKRDRNRGENGFEEFGGYMAAKRSKLDVQFNEREEAGVESAIFSGVSININGYVNPTNLRTIFLQHGGKYDSFPSSATSFIVAENLSEATKRKYGSMCIRSDWIVQSIAAGKKLDHRPFLLYNLNEEKKQKTITQVLGASHAAKQPVTVPVTISEPIKEVSPPKIHEGRQQMVDSSEKQHAPMVFKCWEDGFLEDFWSRSRLHHISTMKRTFQQFVATCRRNRNHQFPELELFRQTVEASHQSNDQSANLSNDSSVMFLIDMDCFFVSVGRLTRPHMRNRPVAVTHFGGFKNISSHSDIACASYEARKCGVKNGMWVSEAKILCPDIEVIPYDFEAYKRVSTTFFEIVLGLTLDVEPGSCDEMLVDVTTVLRTVSDSTPEILANFLRKRIFEKTKCPASIGIGKNRLLAKLASKKAKPDGVFRVNDEDISTFMLGQSIRDIPGIGWNLMEKLSAQHSLMETCEELQKLKLEELRNLFGMKTGETIYNSSRGIAERKLSFEFERPKSVSIDVNFGIRMTEHWQLEKFMMNMAKALCARAEQDSAKGLKLVLSVLTQQKGAPEPSKLGGHGHCDKHNLSSKILHPTRDPKEIYQKTMSLLSTISAPVNIYRGLALALTNLKFDFDGGDGARQQTLFTSMARAQEKHDEAQRIASSKSSKISKVINAETDDVVDVENLSDTEVQLNNIINDTMTITNTTTTTTRVGPTARLPDVDKNTSAVIGSSGEQIDLSVLASLPDDIAREVASFYGISKEQAGLLPNGNGNGSSSAMESAQSKEPVASTSKAGGGGSSSNSRRNNEVRRDELNPYDCMSQLDRNFLQALPKGIRQELELDFAHVKLQQRLPLQQQEKEKTSKTIAKPKVSPPSNLKSHEPRRVESVPAPSRREINQVSDGKAAEPPQMMYRAVRRLPGETDADPPFRRVNWWHFNQKDKLPTDKDPGDYVLVQSKKLPPPILLPALNEETDIGKIRNLIRDGMRQLPNPNVDDVNPLMEYFKQLISGRFLQQTVILLKFLQRMSNSPETNKCWSKIFQHIITNTQKRCTNIFGCPVELDE